MEKKVIELYYINNVKVLRVPLKHVTLLYFIRTVICC